MRKKLCKKVENRSLGVTNTGIPIKPLVVQQQKKNRVDWGDLIDFQCYFLAPFLVIEQNVWRGPKFSFNSLDCCVWVTKKGRRGSHWKAAHVVTHRSLFYFVSLGSVSGFLKEVFFLRALSDTIQTVSNMKYWTENLGGNHSLIRHLNCWVVSLHARLNSQQHLKTTEQQKVNPVKVNMKVLAPLMQSHWMFQEPPSLRTERRCWRNLTRKDLSTSSSCSAPEPGASASTCRLPTLSSSLTATGTHTRYRHQRIIYLWTVSTVGSTAWIRAYLSLN